MGLQTDDGSAVASRRGPPRQRRAATGEALLFADGKDSAPVRRLREKIERKPAEPEMLRTVWGVGYRLDVATESA
jgi:Transcriptional regulatory protein, C terminal